MPQLTWATAQQQHEQVARSQPPRPPLQRDSYISTYIPSQHLPSSFNHDQRAIAILHPIGPDGVSIRIDLYSLNDSRITVLDVMSNAHPTLPKERLAAWAIVIHADGDLRCATETCEDMIAPQVTRVAAFSSENDDCGSAWQTENSSGDAICVKLMAEDWRLHVPTRSFSRGDDGIIGLRVSLVEGQRVIANGVVGHR